MNKMTPSTIHLDNTDKGRQPFQHNWLHKLLHKQLRIPRSMIQPFLMAVKIVGSPGQYRLRKRLAKENFASNKKRMIIPNKAGYRFFESDDIPGIDEVVRYCTRVFDNSRTIYSPEYLQKNPTKGFLLPILEGVEFCEHPQLIQFMLSRPILEAVIEYLGTIPRLVAARLCWSPPNETSRSSQLFHCDFEDLRQVKVFINIFETKQEQGPLTFLPADISEKVESSLGRVLGRVQDDRIYEGGGRNHELKLLGPAGSGVFLDTSRCLHYGSRFNRKDRLVLIIQFLNTFSSFRPTALFKVPSNLPGLNLDPVQKLALGI